MRIKKSSPRVRDWTSRRKEGRHIKSRHVEYTPNWQWDNLEWLTKYGHSKGVNRRSGMHVCIEHVNQKMIIWTM